MDTPPQPIPVSKTIAMLLDAHQNVVQAFEQVYLAIGSLGPLNFGFKAATTRKSQAKSDKFMEHYCIAWLLNLDSRVQGVRLAAFAKPFSAALVTEMNLRLIRDDFEAVFDSCHEFVLNSRDEHCLNKLAQSIGQLEDTVTDALEELRNALERGHVERNAQNVVVVHEATKRGGAIVSFRDNSANCTGALVDALFCLGRGEKVKVSRAHAYTELMKAFPDIGEVLEPPGSKETNKVALFAPKLIGLVKDYRELTRELEILERAKTKAASR